MAIGLLHQRRRTLIQFATIPTPAKPAAAKETEAATDIAETLNTVPTLTSMLATTAVVTTFCWICTTEAMSTQKGHVWQSP